MNMRKNSYSFELQAINRQEVHPCMSAFSTISRFNDDIHSNVRRPCSFANAVKILQYAYINLITALYTCIINCLFTSMNTCVNM